MLIVVAASWLLLADGCLLVDVGSCCRKFTFFFIGEFSRFYPTVLLRNLNIFFLLVVVVVVVVVAVVVVVVAVIVVVVCSSCSFCCCTCFC